MSAPAPTPMMAQYLALKAEAGECLLFYRMGDFFELFFDDARAAAATLDIALTSRGDHGGEPVPMCGVPVHAADAYLARLIRAGHRVAIAEQTESPEAARKARGSKALVNRAIVRFVTAGTLTEEALLDARADNWLVALAEAGGRVGIGAADISTGRFELMSIAPGVEGGAVGAELARLAPQELIAPEGWDGAPAEAALRPRGEFASVEGERRLKERFGLAALDALERDGGRDRAALAAAAGLLCYVEHAARGGAVNLAAPRVIGDGATLCLDQATRESLEILCTQAGERRGSLLHAVDRTVTGAGARALARDLAAPLTDRSRIEARLGLVTGFFEAPLLREEVRGALRRLPDLSRALGRIVAGRGSPRDLGAVRDALAGARALKDRLEREVAPPLLMAELLPALGGEAALRDLLARALVAQPPTESAAGGFIAEGYDAGLDELRRAASAGRRAIAALEARYRAATGVAALKVRHNNVLGYYIEVPPRAADALMRPEAGFTHRQTLAGAVRFNAPDLHEEASRIATAGGHALSAELAHFEELVEAVKARAGPLTAMAEALARFDVAAALAERAAEGGWTRPRLEDQPCLEIEAGRHPVVEAALAAGGGRFVPNDCALGPEDRLWLVSGPNMGGKSTFLRQTALILLLAQAGSFVPASRARIGIADRLFSRVGASDNLARGRSTFMVEMVETAAILTQATPRSLVVLDEIGRGTSTYDGLALAWAVAEWVHDECASRCLFATHYHELARLGERLAAASLHHVRAREWKGELVLLHELAPGPADRSYGLAVAKLAGVPAPVLARARAILGRLEKGREATGGITAGLDELPLFAAARAAAEEDEKGDALRERLSGLDIDAMSPREALDVLYELQREARGAPTG